MFDIELRNMKSRFIEPFLHPIASVLNPVVITLMSFFTGVGALVTFWFGYRLAAVLLWVACRVLDGLDGMVARASGRQSDFGGYLDLVGDFVLYAALPLVIALRLGETIHFMVAALLLATFYVNAAVWMTSSALFEKRKSHSGSSQTSMIMPRGFIEGFETMVFNCLMLFFPQYFIPLTLSMTALTLLGAVIRFIQTLWVLRK